MNNKEFLDDVIHKYERYIAPGTFVLGFVFDALTLKRIDLWAEHAIILAYLGLVGLGIALINLPPVSRLRRRLPEAVLVFLPLIMQFGFGGLFSAFLIFYTKSAAFGKSWLFLLVLIFLFIGNERFRKRYERLIFQVAIYFTALFSYAVFLVPIILKQIGDGTFLLSGAVSLGLVALFVLFLKFISPAQVRDGKRGIIVSIGSIYILFNIFYFANIIPPVPLSLKEGGVYHSIARLPSGEYGAAYEKAPRYLFLQETDSTYHWKRGEPVYFFSAVFAPTKLSTAIIHRWSRYDVARSLPAGRQGWVELESIGFQIDGGRDGGYRGYSFKTGIEPGRWRVEVMTERGQVLGGQTFEIVEVTEPPKLEVEVK